MATESEEPIASDASEPNELAIAKILISQFFTLNYQLLLKGNVRRSWTATGLGCVACC